MKLYCDIPDIDTGSYYNAKIWSDHSRHNKGNTSVGVLRKGTKLRASDIPEIRERLRAGEAAESVAADFWVNVSTVQCVKQRKSWDCVE